MINPANEKLSVTRQCKLAGVSRSSYYYRGSRESELNLSLMRVIDEQYMKTPWYGSRQMTRHLRRAGYPVSRKRVRRLMRTIGITAIYRKPRTSVPSPEHRVYPYLLRDLSIERVNQVWSSDITYIPMRCGFLYLVAVMDVYSRRVLSWRLSNTMDVSFCVEAVAEALANYGSPEIFNTDQGCQFTSFEFTDVLLRSGVRVSMDGKGRWVDNVFIERLWRSLKYECVYLRDFGDGREARDEIGRWLEYYNCERPHSSLCGGCTPEEMYNGVESRLMAA